jgi:polysaccharide export outer membrane protein
MKAFRAGLLLCSILTITACEHRPTTLPSGAAAYQAIPSSLGPSDVQQVYIAPFDVLDVSVFQEPDLSLEDVAVDADGMILFPLLGRVRAAGKSPAQLADDLRASLQGRYIVKPQVTVAVTQSVAQRVTVEGLVNEPGVFDVRGATTLLSVLARAKSPTESAALNEVVVFRFVDGQRMGAVFNLRDIRSGDAPDPKIIGGDTVVVGFSEVRSNLRLLLQTIPGFAVFRPF